MADPAGQRCTLVEAVCAVCGTRVQVVVSVEERITPHLVHRVENAHILALEEPEPEPEPER